MVKFICKIIVKNTVKGSKTKEIKGGKESEICIQGKCIGTNETN